MAKTLQSYLKDSPEIISKITAWCPRGHHFSAKCPRCGSSKIASDNDGRIYISTIVTIIITFIYVVYSAKGW